MEDAELNALASKIDQLIRLTERLREENRQLCRAEQGWHAERSRLLEQHQLARQAVESMISRLKALEQTP